MNHPNNRITSVFLCHPNSKVIAREVEVALAQCGLLPVTSDTEVGSSVIRLYSGAGMWHVLEVTPLNDLWQRVSEEGLPFFQLLGKQLLAPGFVGISASDGEEGEVFLELDAQGNMRASGSWGATDNLGGIALMQPIQPFSSGLKSLWAAGQTQAAIEGIKGVTPVQAFLRMALHRLAGEQLAASEDRSIALVYEARFAEAPPEAIAAHLAARKSKIEPTANLNAVPDAAVSRVDVSSVPPISGDAQVPSEALVAMPVQMPSEASINLALAVAVATPPPPAVPNEPEFEVLTPLMPESGPALVEEILEYVYVDGQALKAGDALAIDDGLSSARLQGIVPDDKDRAGFLAQVEVLTERVQNQGGAVFLARAKCIARDVATHQEAEAQVIEWLKARVQEQDVRAMLLMGIRLLQGTGVEKDPREAYEHLLRAAEHGSAMAQYLVGSMSKSPTRSVRYWSKAAEQGHAPSWFLLGLAHFKGKGVSQSRIEARNSFEQAARLGHLPAIYNLGVLEANCEQALLEDPDTKITQLQAQADQGNAVATWALAQASMRSGHDVNMAHVGQLLVKAAVQGFLPAGAMLVELSDSDELTQTQRTELLEMLKAQATNSAVIQRVLGTIQTQANCPPATVLEGVGRLKQAAQANDAPSLERLGEVKMHLLAHAAELRMRADSGSADEPSLLLDVQLTAQALQQIVDGGQVSLGPNALVQLRGLYELAEKLGDASAKEQLASLRSDPSWEHAKLLGHMTQPAWANGVLDGVGQLENLTTLPPPEDDFLPEALGAPVMPEQPLDAPTPLLNLPIPESTSDVVPLLQPDFVLAKALEEQGLTPPEDAFKLDLELELDAPPPPEVSDPPLITSLPPIESMFDETEEPETPQSPASLDVTEPQNAVAARVAQAKAQARAEEEAMQERLRDSLVLSRSDDAYESSLSEEDIAILGAFKNMPSFDVLETMSAPEQDEAYQSSLTMLSKDTQGHHSQMDGEAGPSSIMAKADSVLPEPAQTVFESEHKKKSWWKFW